MKKRYLSLLYGSVTVLAAVEPIVSTPIIGLTLFKDGIAVVERSANPGPGAFLIDEKIKPRHGTPWVSPADGNPKRNRLEWEIDLKSGEELKFGCIYSVPGYLN